MSTDWLVAALASAAVAWAVALDVLRLRLRNPPAWAVRSNYAGRPVPAVAGGPLTIGVLASFAVAVAAAATGIDVARTDEEGIAVLMLVVVMYLAGAWDDRRGDERPRGFSGHLAAARGGRVTGGLVKLIAGGAAGLAAGALVSTDLAGVASAGLVVALTANLINLLDRAPGRAAKVTLLIAAGATPAAPAAWVVAAAAPMGALIACLPADLDERVMLGDAGANPVGAVAGLGLALALHGTGRWVAVGLLLAFNLASERISFSRVIERSAVLRALDLLGRRDAEDH